MTAGGQRDLIVVLLKLARDYLQDEYPVYEGSR